MVFEIIFSKKFAKSLKRLKKSGSFDIKQLETVINLLMNKLELPARMKDHSLKGEWLGFRECHIQPDLLLIYEISKNELRLAEIGSHSELFG